MRILNVLLVLGIFFNIAQANEKEVCGKLKNKVESIAVDITSSLGQEDLEKYNSLFIDNKIVFDKKIDSFCLKWRFSYVALELISNKQVVFQATSEARAIRVIGGYEIALQNFTKGFSILFDGKLTATKNIFKNWYYGVSLVNKRAILRKRPFKNGLYKIEFI
ncbi:MAG: hypothetical protein N4A33_05965 [Bacteriovoracaceae bacterium]|jgi:hypothetical protein|nr:hypothetical protein [Bacteriovoracaceae bacterium]